MENCKLGKKLAKENHFCNANFKMKTDFDSRKLFRTRTYGVLPKHERLSSSRSCRQNTTRERILYVRILHVLYCFEH